MMHSDKCAIKTAEDELFYLISLPYGNEAFNMFILLPKSDLTDSEMLSFISWERISQLKNDARYELSKISMPKFNISSAINVSDMLFNSGIKDWHKILNFTMFDEKKAGLIELNQGLSICVDEKGTDASAISSGVFIDSAMPDSNPGSLELKIDRPFYFFIQKFSTDAMIMSGRISNL